MGKNYHHIIIILVLFAGHLFAQENSRNPHGKIRWDCLNCHTTESWDKMRRPMEFSHDETGFPLIGVHQNTKCVSCHQDLSFKKVGSECADCHTDVHRAQFGSDCQSCHTPENWKSQQEIFELHASRGFPLVGVHAIADCQACHIGEQQTEFAGTSAECSNCHANDFMQSSNPAHPLANFSMDCMTCHQVTSRTWDAPNYTHPAKFELRGAHRQADCVSCHSTTFTGTSQECVSCHQTEYQNSSNPPHQSFGFPQECQACHSEENWERASFNHLQESGFDLQGAHSTIQCISCHVNSQLTGLPRDCIGCHQVDYNGVSDPNHVTGNFPTDCMVCHNQNTWQPADFNHDLSGFPLTGAHQTLDCNSCHTNGNFSNTPSDCYACHQTAYEGTTNPNHIQNNFSTDCMQCHTTTAWQPATFDHSNTNFPLTGAHLNLQCIDCHSNGYTNTPTDCYSCHQDDYNNTTDPDHGAAGFPTDCEQCHNTTDWNNTTWDHDGQYFPIYSGAHNNKWDTCADCHVDPNNYAVFECIFCHEHNQQDMNNEHNDVPNYQYNSQACYDCHPNGNEKMGMFRGHGWRQ